MSIAWSVLVGVEVSRIFLESQHSQITVFEAKCVCVWSVDWNQSGPRTDPYVKFLLVLCVCVLMMGCIGSRIYVLGVYEMTSFEGYA